MSQQNSELGAEEAKDHRPADTEVEESNPNASGPQGLEGGMGVSSERTGPDRGRDSAVGGIEGTGSVGSATDSSEGTMDSSPGGEGETARQHPQDPAEGPDMDEAEGSEDTEAEEGKPSIDRTVGESNPAEVPEHDFDPTRNPGHSHG